MPHAGVDLGGGPGGGGLAGARLGDAPVQPAAAEVGQRLAGPVAQGDHVVEAVAGEGVHVPGPPGGEVDAVVPAERVHGALVHRRSGVGAGAGGRHAAVGVVAQQGLRDRRAGAVAGADEQHGAVAHAPGRRGGPFLVQGRVQGGAGVGQRVGAAVQVEVVVGVAAVEGAAGGGDQAAVAEQPQMVGHQALRLADPGHQLADPQVAVGEPGQQLPAQRVSGQADERRGGSVR